MRFPGEVWFLPPEARAEGDFKWRRHVLLTPCEEHDDTGVFSYASTASIEAAFGGASVLIDPHASTYRYTGFSAPTYVTPCRLVLAASEDMHRMAGRIIDEMPAIRGELRQALGIGTGTARRGVAAGSWRGRVAELGEALAEESGFSLGVIVTEPAYSLARRYQLVVPILDAEEYDVQPNDVVMAGQQWITDLVDSGEVIFAVRLIQAAFHPTELKRVLATVVDDATIAEIDRTVVAMFGL